MEQKKENKENKPGKYEACETQLGIKGGMAGTGLCGPCCTGEAETLEDFGLDW